MIATEENIGAARKALRGSIFLRPMMEGAYAPSYLKRAEELGVEFPSDDMAVIGAKLDFVGANTYAPNYVRAADNEQGYETIQPLASHPRLGPEWLVMEPQVLYWAPRLLKEVWNVTDVIISENGVTSQDRLTNNKEVLDTDRVLYLRNHLLAAERAISEGWPLKGYFLWSILDNFEWSEGFTQRFGIVYVNYTTLERTPKLSAHYYREVIAKNQVM